MAVLGRNIKGEMIGIWYNNYECLLITTAKLLAIYKAFLISYNFRGHKIQIDDSKVAMDALLGIFDCPSCVVSIFKSVKRPSFNNVELF